MPVARAGWEDLPQVTRRCIEQRAGRVLSAEPVTTGTNSALAVVLETTSGRIFAKGLPSAEPAAWTLKKEALINPYVVPVAPHLRWDIETGGWHVLGFEHIDGAPANYARGSPDIPKVLDALHALGQIRPPHHLPLKRAEHRWAAWAGDEAGYLRGDHLLHTDFNPANVLIQGDQARMIDWAWATWGAGWIDPACLVLRLIGKGHQPAEAEARVEALPAWTSAAPEGLCAFAEATARQWDQIAQQRPEPWRKDLADIARTWAQHRAHSLRDMAGERHV